MSKPISGWLIDFRTAKSIFTSGSNARIDHCVDEVEAGRMKICHTEAKDFGSVQSLKDVFGKAVEQIDEPIMQMCTKLQGTGYFPKAGIFDLTPVYVVGTALIRNYGVLCNCRLTPFVTTYSACCKFKVCVKEIEEYFK